MAKVSISDVSGFKISVAGNIPITFEFDVIIAELLLNNYKGAKILNTIRKVSKFPSKLYRL